MDRQFKTIEEITPHTKLYSISTVGEGLDRFVAKVEHNVAPFFTVKETLELMKLYADLCVGKKLIDMGYKEHVTGDPEGDLAELIMLPWFRENED